MNYKVVKSYNNNLILATDQTEKKLVIIGKGVGFGRKTDDLIQVNPDNDQLFYILDDTASAANIQQLGYDFQKLDKAVKEIVSLSKETLGIVNPALYDALMDHVSFAIQRLKMGLSIDNPFIEEISILYSKEYALAEQAAEIISQAIDVSLGEAECGFIALHLRSARKEKPISMIMKTPRVYKEILNLIGKEFGVEYDTETTNSRSFLLSIDWLVRLSARNQCMENILMNDIEKNMPKYVQVAKEISYIIEKEMNVILSKEHQMFLASDIYRFVQYEESFPVENNFIRE